MPRRKPKLELGTLLAIPSGGRGFAVGQILVAGIVFYLGIDPVDRLEFNSSSDFEPQLFAWTNDAEAYRGNWRVLPDVRPAPAAYWMPNYKVGIEGQIMVESFAGELLRDFDPIADAHLNYRSSFSPLLVQDAVQARAGYGDWKPHFDKMLPVLH